MNNADLRLAGQPPKIEKTDFCRRTNDMGMNWYDLSINYNNAPYKSDTVILVTTYYGHLKFLIKTLLNYRKTGKFVLCAYDHHFKGWDALDQETMKQIFPRPDHFLLANAWVFKHVTYDDDKRNGWLWSLRYAQGIIKQFPNLKYIFCVNGDCIWEKPENVDQIKGLLGEGDLISGQSTGSTIHTASVLYKADAFNKIVDYMAEQIKVPIMGSRSPEVLLKEAVDKMGLKEVLAAKQPKFKGTEDIDFYSSYAQDSTWKDILGYRNIFAELDTSAEERLDPPPVEFLDFYDKGLYFRGYEQDTLYQYFVTGDKRYKIQWWDQSHDDYRFRKYLPIEHYGKEPIYER